MGSNEHGSKGYIIAWVQKKIQFLLVIRFSLKLVKVQSAKNAKLLSPLCGGVTLSNR